MKIPQPIQYQGSKRKLAPFILSHISFPIERLVEPFAGSAAISVFAAASKPTSTFWLNDLNAPLTRLLEMMVKTPASIADFYEDLWAKQFIDEFSSVKHYYEVRELFNRTNDEKMFLYLLARCVKGAVRYNTDGYFNQSPDKRRYGTRPSTMRENIYKFSVLLKDRVTFTTLDYQKILEQVGSSDLVYLDPPYQGVCGDRDSRYYAQITFDRFINTLHCLNERNIPYLLSYDGKTGNRSYGNILPASLQLQKVELEAGRSTQATLLGKAEITFESLYLSPEVVTRNQHIFRATQSSSHSSLLAS
jgi:DNA adenine methylase